MMFLRIVVQAEARRSLDEFTSCMPNKRSGVAIDGT